jgi:uncharacterized membrane protein
MGEGPGVRELRRKTLTRNHHALRWKWQGVGRAAAAKERERAGVGIEFVPIVELAGRIMEATGVAIIVVGSIIATIFFFRDVQAGVSPPIRYRDYRQAIGRAILLGLEFLVAGDIIRSVAVEPSFQSVGVLAIIVLIRTFLSLSLELETEGRWPWQQTPTPPEPSVPTPPSAPG